MGYVNVLLVLTSRGRRRLWSIPWAAACMCCADGIIPFRVCRCRVSWPRIVCAVACDVYTLPHMVVLHKGHFAF